MINYKKDRSLINIQNQSFFNQVLIFLIPRRFVSKMSNRTILETKTKYGVLLGPDNVSIHDCTIIVISSYLKQPRLMTFNISNKVSQERICKFMLKKFGRRVDEQI